MDKVKKFVGQNIKYFIGAVILLLVFLWPSSSTWSSEETILMEDEGESTWYAYEAAVNLTQTKRGLFNDKLYYWVKTVTIQNKTYRLDNCGGLVGQTAECAIGEEDNIVRIHDLDF